MAIEGNEFISTPGRAPDAGPDRIRWWQWPTALSLDAPVVAVLWQWMIARTARVEPGAPQAWVLGASVWLAYAADRWIEAWRLHPDRIRTSRHRFYQRARWPVAAVWVAVFGADLFEAFARLSGAELRGGFLLLVPVVLYLLSHQLVHRHRRWRAPKELCVAALLSGGVAVFVLSRSGAARAALVLPLGLFFLLCFANCVLISGWEHEVDKSHGQTSLALQFRHAAVLGRSLSWSLAALCCLAALAARGPGRTALGCAAAGAGLLGIVDLAEKRLGWQLTRVLADVALMTPAVPLAAAWDPMNREAVRFDRLARFYRTLEVAAFGRDLERARFCFLHRAAAARDILLLGEGDGRCSARLAAVAPEARIHIVDSSPAMIGLARRRLAGLAAPERVHFACADVFSMELPPAGFDAVTTFFFLDCFPAGQVETLVARIGPALRPGAAWLYADFSLPDRGWARMRGRAWLALLYAFFRWQTGLQTDRLPPSESILAHAGWHEGDAREYQAGLVRSAVFTR